MFIKIKKIILSAIVLISFQASFAFELCSLDGDFVPWPWSEQYYDQVVSQNWFVMNSNGIVVSEVSLSRANILSVWDRDVFILMEKDLDGRAIKWGMATKNKEISDVKLDFNMWGSSESTTKQTYSVQMGYWRSSKEQMTIDEEEAYKNSPNLVQPFSPLNRACKSFRQRTDKVIGLVLDVKTENTEGVESMKLFGLTQDPIYAED